MDEHDTIVAVASGVGAAPRAIVRVSGTGVARICDQAFVSPLPIGASASRLRLGAIGYSLPVLTLRGESPRTYTGEDTLEVVVPGGAAIVPRVLDRLIELGARPARAGEFTERAVRTGRLSLDRAEGVAAIIAAQNEHELLAARRLLDGTWGRRLAEWSDGVASLLALVEAGIDFTDQEDVVPIAPRDLVARTRVIAGQIESHIRTGGEGSFDGRARVVLAGAPSAGKSTLFNALLGRDRMVTHASPGTTRDAVGEGVVLRGPFGDVALKLVDTPGLEAGGPNVPQKNEPSGADAEAQSAAHRAIESATLVVWCDPTGRFDPHAAPRGTHVVRVRTKGDLPTAANDPARANHADATVAGVIPVCALDAWNMGMLRDAIGSHASRLAMGSGVLPRHRHALDRAHAALHDAIAAAAQDGHALRAPELVASGLRGALDALGEIVGVVTPDDVIGRVFAAFCVGK
ncbi:MAG: GTPase [Phycisphaerales bacterium]|nr:GTPase [Phycisphaerales bacterium]